MSRRKTERNCKQCGGIILASRGARHTCSQECVNILRRQATLDYYYRNREPAPTRDARECAECSAIFTPYRDVNIYCSRRCTYRAADQRKRANRGPRRCAKCGTEVDTVVGTPTCADCKVDPRIRGAEHERRRTLRAYNLTSEQFDEILANQGGACAICGTTNPANGIGRRNVTWSIDHDHGCCPESCGSCGRCIRGLLCGSCNLGIGQLGDDPNRLLAAADYLAQHKGGLLFPSRAA